MLLIVLTTYVGDITFWEKIKPLRVFHNDHTIVCHTNNKPLVIFLLRKKQQLSNNVNKSDRSIIVTPKARKYMIPHLARMTKETRNKEH